MKLIDGVECYGEIEPDSNFYIVCVEEDDDGDWINGNPNSEDGSFSTWKEAVAFFQNNWEGTVIEIGTM